MKRLENRLLLALRNAHAAILDRDHEIQRVVILLLFSKRRRRMNIPGIREFDGVSDEIKQHLPQPGFI